MHDDLSVAIFLRTFDAVLHDANEALSTAAFLLNCNSGHACSIAVVPEGKQAESIVACCRKLAAKLFPNKSVPGGNLDSQEAIARDTLGKILDAVKITHETHERLKLPEELLNDLDLCLMLLDFGSLSRSDANELLQKLNSSKDLRDFP
eukprot:7315725-Pyramimonas_sp.AAC.1